MSVKRYGLSEGNHGYWMGEVSEGPYVSYTDHAAEVARLEAELNELKEAVSWEGRDPHLAAWRKECFDRDQSASVLDSDIVSLIDRAGKARAERDEALERVRALEAQASITDRLFLRVLSQALGEDDNRELHHLFMSAYAQACEWVERKGFGSYTGAGARLKADPFDAEVSWDEMDALAQPQQKPFTPHLPTTACLMGECDICKPQQKEGE